MAVQLVSATLVRFRWMLQKPLQVVILSPRQCFRATATLRAESIRWSRQTFSLRLRWWGHTRWQERLILILIGNHWAKVTMAPCILGIFGHLNSRLPKPLLQA